eukprot:m.65187 g.65187  ORF g.65187 m.65187 type:complete len:368 (+) comp11717_c0_seq1:173-1276(+)
MAANKRGALIGCGFFAVNHMHAWAAIQGVDIVAICDKDPERLSLVGEQFQIGQTHRYTDAKHMLVQEAAWLDFVDIATTVQSHRALVELVVSHGVGALICQKPLAQNMAEARIIVDTCHKKDVMFMVHENFRWQYPIQAVKRLITSGKIGDVFWGRVSFRSKFDVFSGQPYLAKCERFIIEDLGTHILDISRFLFGDIERISARTCRVNPSIVAEDVATMMVAHEGGKTSIVDCSYATDLENELFPQTMIEVDGTQGTIRLGPNYQITVTTREGGVKKSSTITEAPPKLPWTEEQWLAIQQSVQAIQEHFVECLQQSATDGKQVQPMTSGDDNLKTLAAVDAAYLSASSGGEQVILKSGLSTFANKI